MPFLGSCAAINGILTEIERLILNGRPLKRILLQGETGTGKDELARYIYNRLIPDRKFPFVVVDATTLVPTLSESQLFGHARGAFTGAECNLSGPFKEARDGVLFFDEIGELPYDLQGKLLRVLETGTYRPLGCTKDECDTTQCIVFASNRDLEQMVHEGTFRRDLWYRLSTNVIQLPPLRDRKEDIPILVEHFLREFSSSNTPERSLSPSAMVLLYDYPWPGNVRELRNILERVVQRSHSVVIDVDDLTELSAKTVGCRNHLDCKDRDCPLQGSNGFHCWESDERCCRVDPQVPPEAKILVCAGCPVLQEYGQQLKTQGSQTPELRILMQLIKLAKEFQISPFCSWIDRGISFDSTRSEVIERADRAYLHYLVNRFGHDTEAIAQHAQISRRQVQNLLRKYVFSSEDE